MLNALLLQYKSEIAKAKANIRVYLKNPAGIGEHPDLVSAVDSQIEIIANAEDKISVINNYYKPQHKPLSRYPTPSDMPN
jgi:DnaJ-domain-containing protein 1